MIGTTGEIHDAAKAVAMRGALAVRPCLAWSVGAVR